MIPFVVKATSQYVRNRDSQDFIQSFQVVKITFFAQSKFISIPFCSVKKLVIILVVHIFLPVVLSTIMSQGFCEVFLVCGQL